MSFSDSYLVAMWLHILSSTVLFGTGIGTAFQMVWAMRSKDPQIIHATASGVVVADMCFTLPAGIVQPLTGAWLIWLSGHAWNAPWLLGAYGLYLVAFCCWLPVVRLQKRMRDLAGQAKDQSAPLPSETLRAYRLWFALGWPAFIGLVGVFWLMVSKPTFGL